MMAVLLVAGIGMLLVGLLTMGFGIQLDLSFGNTLILVGAIVACTGVIMLGFWIAIREMRAVCRQLAGGAAAESRAPQGNPAPEDGLPAPSHADHSVQSAHASSPPPWHPEPSVRDRVPAMSEQPVEVAPPAKQRRNLMFASTSRKERERAEARATEPSAVNLGRPTPDPATPPVSPASDTGGPSSATFDDAWPKSGRTKAGDVPSPRHGGRAPTTSTEAGAGADRHPPAARSDDREPITVLKSGVVDGMAYSLYSDGSIEAQMPEGMMRFASIDELRSHLDQRS